MKLKGSISDDEKYQLPSDFLMEMMDFNEELETMAPEIAKEKVRQFEKDIYDNVKEKLVQNTEINSTSDLIQLKEFYYKKKYLQRILDRLED